MTNYFIRDGFVEKVSNKDSDARTTGFDLKRWLKKLLIYLHVQTFDACCDTDVTVRPVRFNVTDGIIEYFDGTTWTDTGFVQA